MNKIYCSNSLDSSDFEAHPTISEDSRIISSTVTLIPLVQSSKVFVDSKRSHHSILGTITLVYSSGGYTGTGVCTRIMSGNSEYVVESLGSDVSFIMENAESESGSLTIPITNGTSTSTVTINNVYFKCLKANQDCVEIE